MPVSELQSIDLDFARWHAAISLDGDPAHRDMRLAGILAIAAEASKRDIEGLVRLAFKSRQGATPEQVDWIRKKLIDADASFPMEDNERELQVLSGAAIAATMKQGLVPGAFAALAVTTTSLDGAREPDLPVNLAKLAETAIAEMANTNRRRPILAGDPTETKLSLEKAAEKYKEQPNPDGFTSAMELASETIRKGLSVLARKQANSLKSMETFLHIQDEELQMLWWLVGGRSEDLSCAFDSVDVDARALVLSKELGDHTEILPGPPSVQGLLSRAGLKSRKTVPVVKAIEAAPADWLEGLVRNVVVSPVLTPLHFGISRQLETGTGTTWVPGWAAATGLPDDISLSVLRLGEFFYRERLFLLFDEEGNRCRKS